MLKANNDNLEIDWLDGTLSLYHWQWLRQSCECSVCFNSYCRQRYFDPCTFFVDTTPESFSAEGENLSVLWKDGHRSVYSLDLLRRKTYSGKPTRKLGPKKVAWADWPTDALPRVRFGLNEALEDDVVVYDALQSLFQFGLAVFKADERSVVDSARICDRLGGLLDRSYFGDYFDLEVKDESTTDSVAFSTKELPLHTDIPYYSPPPEYQFLYGLDVNSVRAPSGSGSTRFVDGVTIAREMRESMPDDFAILSRVPVVYRAAFPTADRIYENRTPIIQLGADGSIERLLNNPSKMFFDGVGYDDMLPLFKAYRKFKTLLSEARNSHYHSWATADMVVWDNRRIFHGREDFGAVGVTRSLRGGYFKEVELFSRARYLTSKLNAGNNQAFPSGF